MTVLLDREGANDQPMHTIGRVAELTGLAPSTLRVWEEVYGLLQPRRSRGGTRLYSPRDVDLVCQIKALHQEQRLGLQVIASLLGRDPGGNEPSPQRQPTVRLEELERLFTLAKEADVAIENARLLAKERHRSAVFQAVTAVQHRLSTALSQNTVFPYIAEVIQKALGFPTVNIFTLAPGKRELHLLATAGETTGKTVPDLILRLSQSGPNERAAHSARPCLLRDLRGKRRSEMQRLFPHSRSELAVPILLRGQVLGTLDVHRTEPDGFDETDLLALQTLAEQVALVLETRAAFEDLQRLNRQLLAALEVSTVLSAERQPDRLLELIVRQAGELSGAETVAIPVRCHGPAGETIRYAAAWGRHAEILQGMEVPLDQAGFCGWVITHQEPLLTDHALRDSRANRDLLLRLKVKAALVVPMVSPDGVEGGLTALNKGDGGSFTEQDLQLLRLFSNHAAVSLRNSRLLSGREGFPCEE